MNQSLSDTDIFDIFYSTLVCNIKHQTKIISQEKILDLAHDKMFCLTVKQMRFIIAESLRSPKNASEIFMELINAYGEDLP